jgi:hypothetical protein
MAIVLKIHLFQIFDPIILVLAVRAGGEIGIRARLRT